MTNEQVARMAGISGDMAAGKPLKYIVPLIRFDGNRGEFRMISLDEDNKKIETPLKKPLTFVMLKKRRLLSSYSPTVSYFSTEHNSATDRMQLFSNSVGVVKFEASGFAPELREKYQDIKTHEVIYLLYDGQVCKFEVKGGSLGGYYTYLKELQAESLHSFQVETVVSSEKAKNDTGFAYHRVTFKFVQGNVDLDEVEKYQLEVNENIKKIDDFFAAKMKQHDARAKEVAPVTSEPKPDDISPEDIPF